MSYKYLLITCEGLEELTNTIKDRERKCTLRKVNKDRFKLENPAEGLEVTFNPSKELDIKTRSLKNYFEKADEYNQNWEEAYLKKVEAVQEKIKSKKEKLERKKKEYEFRRERKLKRMKERQSRTEKDKASVAAEKEKSAGEKSK